MPNFNSEMITSVPENAEPIIQEPDFPREIIDSVPNFEKPEVPTRENTEMITSVPRNPTPDTTEPTPVPEMITSVPFNPQASAQEPAGQMPEIIDSVPGFDKPEVNPDPRAVVDIQEADFRGDPSRVIGHPSNPSTVALDGLTAQIIGERSAGSQPDEDKDLNVMTTVAEINGYNDVIPTVAEINGPND